MKLVRTTITLPTDLATWIDEQSRKGGEPANASKYIRDLIRRDKEESQNSTRKKAA